ncbi:MAG: NACHT domain-containing NTPase, partial [Crocosphaera sp.]
MSKYSFDRLQPKQFEAMCQALLEKKYRAHGNLIQFGEGADGGREATWTQTLDHPDYVKPSNVTEKVPKEWIFQVKYHDGSQLGWNKARKAVVRDLNRELEKIVHKYEVPCHAYVMITNVPFTGVITDGTRDKITDATKKWKQDIPEIYVWDAADISCMLDADQDVRISYLGSILPGDILNAIYQDISYKDERKKSALKAYLNYVLKCESSAKAQDAGDAQNLPLSEVFIDFTLSLLDFQIYRESVPFANINPNQNNSEIELFPDYKSALSPSDWSKVRASHALFFLNSEFILLLGGPGLGKSTLTQFLSLYQAARVVKTDLALSLAKRLKLPQEIKTENLDSYVSLFFPFRVELRRYAKWMSEQFNNDGETHLALYIVKKLINENTSSSLEMDDIFGLASTDPILLILDGLGEVPNPETRRKIIENLRVFVNRVKAENGKLQVILSSRPKGYSGEFSEFEPVIWQLNKLERADFDEYCERWLQQRSSSAEEQREAKEKIEAAMESEAVQRLAESLLQATVILTIVRSPAQIPHEKHSLYATYVKVIFDREKNKTPLVKKWAKELLQLHERVGFELHCKMEKKIENSEPQGLKHTDFRSYIHDIIGNYPGEIFEGSTLNRTTDEIIEMATDRLCLLAGTGENQGQIDFLLQQYREYFAASYLTKH